MREPRMGSMRPAARVTSLELQLRFGDTDALGHINNAAYSSYAELGRIDFIERLQQPPGGFILARLATDFRRQVVLSDSCHITTEVLDLGNTSFTMRQVLYANDQLAAEFEAVVVWFDYELNRPVRVPDEVREQIAALPE